MSREDDSIVPGERIGPFRLGSTEQEVLTHVAGGSVHREQRGAMQVLHAGSLSFWFDSGVLTQVGAHSSYGGTTARGIGVGSTVGELSNVGQVGLDLDDGVLVLEEVEGICFDVEQGLPEMSHLLAASWSRDLPLPGFDLDADWTISWIGVFDPDRLAELEEAEDAAQAEDAEG